MAVDMEEKHETATQVGTPRRKHHKLLIAGGVVTLVVGGAIGAGIAAGGGGGQHATVNLPAATQPAPATPAPTTPPATSATQLTVGQTATITQAGKMLGTITVTSVSVTTSYQPPAFGTFVPPAATPANGYFVVANITVTSTSNQWPYNALYFYGLDANGTHYSEGNGNAIQAMPGPGSMFGSGELNTGETATGQIPFDMATAGDHIVYAPMLFGTNGPVAEWAFGS